MSVGENIRKIRTQKGLTQKRLGERCGINEANIRKYELGIAHPKIETIEKIASGLGVNIVDILDQFTADQYKTTSEFRRLENAANAIDGVIDILIDIYGKVEEKSLSGDYGESYYYVVGESPNQFILYDGMIDALYQSVKASFPALVDVMKDETPEKEVVKKIMKELNTPQ